MASLALDIPGQRAPEIPVSAKPAYDSYILRVVCYLLLAGLYLSRLTQHVVDLDVFHEMALARESLRLGHLPVTDLFAYTPTLPVSIQHEWGAGFIAYFLTSYLGGAGIVLLKLFLALALASFCLLCARSRRSTLGLLVIVGIPAALLVGVGFAPVRGQMYSFAFAAVLLYCLRLDELGSRRWILLWLCVFCVWVNVHGGFVVGIGFVALHWLEQILRRRQHWHAGGVLVAMCLLISANPYGFGYYRYLWTALTMPRPEITEWWPLWLGLPAFYVCIFALCVVLVLYLLWTARVTRLPHIAILFVTIAASIAHTRMVPFFAIVFFCYMPGYLMRTRLPGTLERFLFHPSQARIVLWGIPAFFFMAWAFHVQFWRLEVPGQLQSTVPSWIVYPVGPVRYLTAQQFSGNVLVPFEQGSYVSWKLYPRVRVSVDSRYEVAYPDWLVDQMFRFYRAERGWQTTLAAYPTDLLLIRRDQPLVHRIHETAWKKVYSDSAFELYARPGLRLNEADWSRKTLYDVVP